MKSEQGSAHPLVAPQSSDGSAQLCSKLRSADHASTRAIHYASRLHTKSDGHVTASSTGAKVSPSGQHVDIEGQGFIPGERLDISLAGHGTSHGASLEGIKVLVQADGSFSHSAILQLNEPNISGKSPSSTSAALPV